MRHPSVLTGALLAIAGTVALSACGSSSSSSSSSTSSSSSAAESSSSASSSTSLTAPAAGSFCTQAASLAGQLAQASSAFAASGAGQTPDVNSIKQLIAADTAVVDTLDSSAPSEIASAFHTLRMAVDQGNAQVQSATTLQQVGSAFAVLNTAAVRSATQTISAYVKTCTGASASSTTT